MVVVAEHVGFFFVLVNILIAQCDTGFATTNTIAYCCNVLNIELFLNNNYRTLLINHQSFLSEYIFIPAV